MYTDDSARPSEPTTGGLPPAVEFAVLAVDEHLRVTALSDCMQASHTGGPPPLGKALRDAFPWANGRVEAAVRAALDRGLTTLVAGGGPAPANVAVTPMIADDGPAGAFLSWVPSPRTTAEEASDAFATLEAMTSALAGVRTTVEALSVIVERCIPAMGVDSSALALMDERAVALRVEATSGDGRGYAVGQALTLDSRYLMCQAVRSGAMLVADEHARVVAAPLRVAGRIVGAVELRFHQGGEGRQLLGAASALWALALGRARTHEAERAARTSLREASNRVAFLAESTRALNESLEFGETLERVARLSVPGLGDICAIHLLRAGVPRLTASAHNGSSSPEQARSWLRDNGGLAQSAALRQVVATGRPTMVHLADRDAARRLAASHRARKTLAGLGLGFVVIVPLSVHGRVLGTMAVATGAQRQEPDLVLAEEIGIRAGTAIERAQLHQEQARAISQLQASLLPPVLPSVEGLELATAFVPASRSGNVGGDFYDAFPVRDKLMLVIGDVQGKGLTAAATTGLVRQSVRAAAVSAQGPADVISHVNQVLLAAQVAGDDPDQLCTLCVLMVATEDDSVTVTMSSGGHPLPLLLPAHGPVMRVGKSDLLVGAFEDQVWTENTVWLSPGDALLCVTDGVTERRHGNSFFEDELDDLVLAARGASAAELVETVRARAVAFSERRPTDDIALLAVRVEQRDT